MGLIILLLGVAIYGFFFATFLYLIVFVGGDMLSFLGMEKTVDSGVPPEFYLGSVAKNVGLLLLFALQHSLMARQSFKRVIRKLIPPALERSFYVLMTSVVLLTIYVYWQPLPGVVWSTPEGIWAKAGLAPF